MEENKKKKIKKPIVAGQFYPSNKEELKNRIKILLEKNPYRRKEIGKRIIAGIVPHAGYIYSGYAAACFYQNLSGQTIEEVIILGPDHTGYAIHDFCFSECDFETPMGIVKNSSLTEKIIKKAEENELDVGFCEEAHKYEHSIEVQLPFLQHTIKKFSLTPIIISTKNFEKLKEFSSILIEVVKKHDKRILLMASSDFTHYGYFYGFVPFPPQQHKKIKEMDHRAISKILAGNAMGFLKEAEKTTICGMSPIVVVTLYSSFFNAKGNLLCYYTSADITHDFDNFVSYASIAFSGNGKE